MSAILTPRCPLCSELPYAVLNSGRQAFCGTPDCKAITWDATKSVDGNMSDINFVDLSGWAGEKES